MTAAGPLLQILSAGVVIALLKLGGYRVTAFAFMPAGLDRVPGMMEGEELLLDSVGLAALVDLLRVPQCRLGAVELDAGVAAWMVVGLRDRLCCSMAVPPVKRCGSASSLQEGLRLYAFHGGQSIMGIFFLMFAISNYQMLQQSGGWR